MLERSGYNLSKLSRRPSNLPRRFRTILMPCLLFWLLYLRTWKLLLSTPLLTFCVLVADYLFYVFNILGLWPSVLVIWTTKCVLLLYISTIAFCLVVCSFVCCWLPCVFFLLLLKRENFKTQSTIEHLLSGRLIAVSYQLSIHPAEHLYHSKKQGSWLLLCFLLSS